MKKKQVNQIKDKKKDSKLCQCYIEQGSEIMKNGRWCCMACGLPIAAEKKEKP